MKDILRLLRWLLPLMLLGSGLAACSQVEGEIPLTASGYLESPRLTLSAEVSGTVAEVFVEKGQSVQAGDSLLRLASPEVEAALVAAQAAVDQAQAALDDLENHPTPAEVAAAQAEVDKAQAQLTAQIRKSLQAVKSAAALGGMPAAQREALAAQIRVARAAVDLAKARLAQVQAGPTLAERAQAQAALRAAQAQLAAAQRQQARLTLAAPTDGMVAQVLVRAGEAAQPGLPLAFLTPADRLDVVVYIPARWLTQIRPGQSVTVRVDAYPGETFRGKVLRIAQEAIFTPGEALSREERVKQVFPVTVRLEEGLDRLHPGMPADVTFTAP